MADNNLEQERQAYNNSKAQKVLKSIVAPDVDKRKRIREGLNDSAYFIIIGLISLLGIIIPPLVNGCLNSDVSLNFPKNLEGWILWGLLNGGTALGNISLLVLFKAQAKKNARNHPNFIKANEILNRLAGKKEVFIPRSPAKMNAQDYTKKITTILLSTVASSVVLTSIVINFDWLTLLSCILSVLISLCVSWIAMINNEEYWVNEYILYAEMKAKELSAAEAEDALQAQSESIQTGTESNVSESDKELSKEKIKEAENA